MRGLANNIHGIDHGKLVPTKAKENSIYTISFNYNNYSARYRHQQNTIKVPHMYAAQECDATLMPIASKLGHQFFPPI